MTVILDGKKVADKITANLADITLKLPKKPKLAVIQAGNDAASEIYVGNKKKKAESVGFDSIVIKLPADVSAMNLKEQIFILNEDENINAILVQLPLPAHINKEEILEAIDPVKDVDGFTSYNFGRLALGYVPFAYPCTPKGVIRLLKEYNIETESKNVTVVGRSNIVGKPLSLMLQQQNATVTMVNSYTKNLKEILYNSDIIISAAGKPCLIGADCVRESAVVIDIGINRVNGKLTGDVDFDAVKEKAAFITPVPGGIGPMTIAMLMENTYSLFKEQQKLFL